MRARRLSCVLVITTLSCAHVVTHETREAPVETGVATVFTDAHDLTWDFGDASSRVAGQKVTHAFNRAGRYTVKAYDGDTLVREVITTVEPRPAFHSVPPDAVSVVLTRNADELAGAVDLAERVIGAASMQRWLDDLPLLSFVLEQGSGRSSLIDAREGLGVFTLAEPDVTVSFVGVTDGTTALKSLSVWLVDHGWEASPTSFIRDEHQLDVFVDRGVLYAAFGASGNPSIAAAIAGGPALGLHATPAIADALNDVPAGAWVIFSRALTVKSQWSIFAGSMSLSAREARFAGRLLADEPLWVAPEAPAGRLLEHAPEGPVAALSLSMPPKTLASLIFGNPGTARRERLARQFGSDVEQAIDSFVGVLDAAAYFDAESFYRSTVESEGRPTPRGTLLVEAAMNNSFFFGHFLDAVFLQNMIRASRAQDKGLNVWRFAAFGEPFELALTPSTFFVKAGEAVKGRAGIDFVSLWRKQFDDAFAPGHLSLLLDVGQLRRELMEPRFISGLDPRRVVTAQAIAQTLLDRVTQVEAVLFDAAPDAHGATVQAVVRVREKERSE